MLEPGIDNCFSFYEHVLKIIATLLSQSYTSNIYNFVSIESIRKRAKKCKLAYKTKMPYFLNIPSVTSLAYSIKCQRLNRTG